MMKPLIAAIGIVALWGFNFVVIKLGLDDMPPLLLCACGVLQPWKVAAFVLVIVGLCVNQFGARLYAGVVGARP